MRTGRLRDMLRSSIMWGANSEDGTCSPFRSDRAASPLPTVTPYETAESDRSRTTFDSSLSIFSNSRLGAS
jgi:hypothetical protein